MMEWFDKEVERLEEELDRGEITTEEYNKEMRELRHALRGEAEEVAERAYNDTMGGW